MGALLPIRQPRGLVGPDLACLPTLAEQLAQLDAAVGDPDVYADVWLAVCDELGSIAYARWPADCGDDGDPDLYGPGVVCDVQERDRRLRADAIREHRPADDRYRHAMVRLLLRRGLYSDDRSAPRVDVFRALRDALATRTKVLINPEGRLEIAGGCPQLGADGLDDADLEAAVATRQALHRMLRRWRGLAIVKRAVRMAGKRRGDWLVLEAL